MKCWQGKPGQVYKDESNETTAGEPNLPVYIRVEQPNHDTDAPLVHNTNSDAMNLRPGEALLLFGDAHRHLPRTFKRRVRTARRRRALLQRKAPTRDRNGDRAPIVGPSEYWAILAKAAKETNVSTTEL